MPSSSIRKGRGGKPERVKTYSPSEYKKDPGNLYGYQPSKKESSPDRRANLSAIHQYSVFDRKAQGLKKGQTNPGNYLSSDIKEMVGRRLSAGGVKGQNKKTPVDTVKGIYRPIIGAAEKLPIVGGAIKKGVQAYVGAQHKNLMEIMPKKMGKDIPNQFGKEMMNPPSKLGGRRPIRSHVRHQ